MGLALTTARAEPAAKERIRLRLCVAVAWGSFTFGRKRHFGGKRRTFASFFASSVVARAAFNVNGVRVNHRADTRSNDFWG